MSWLLRGLYLKDSEVGDGLALKGGTAMRKVYFPHAWRFSEDLDFTAIASRDADRIKESMQDIFRRLRDESGVTYSFESFHSTEGSIIANVQFVGPLNFVNRIRHDITLREKMVLGPERRTVRSSFPDLPSFKILVYPLAEILAEKIRSIMQRGYSRDYYDVWRLLKETEFKDSDIKSLLIQKCELNMVSYQPALLFDEKRLTEARSFWIKGLTHLTKDLPDFNEIVPELKERLEFLQE